MPARVIFPKGCLHGPDGMPSTFINVLYGSGFLALHVTGPYGVCSCVLTVTKLKSGWSA